MDERHYFADVNLPFHVWVRESSGADGARWVLRDASSLGRDGKVDADAASSWPAARSAGD